MLTKCYAVYAEIPFSPIHSFDAVYCFTYEKKNAKKLVKHVKKARNAKS